MTISFLMGNEAIALGAIRAGVGLVSGYPGTPSTEVLETIAKQCPDHTHIEWSVNEKSALEVAAGAAYAGARTLVTMKQVGLNVASDPLMSLAYIGIKGGMVVLVADDPGPISSQTEQDTRRFAAYAKLPIFDPASPEEAYEMIGEAFDYSEKYQTPVLFRPTTRICHGCATIDLSDERRQIEPSGFVKDSKWVIFPRLTFQNHRRIEKRNPELGDDFSGYERNRIENPQATVRRGIATGGVSYAYTKEALELLGAEDACKLLKVATPFPFPEKLALDFLAELDEVLVPEELDPVIGDALTMLCGKHHLKVRILDKRSGHIPPAGENTVPELMQAIASFLELPYQPSALPELPELPVRPPVLCAGCPHRASFYAVKQAMKGRKAVFSGDIGCYTLGNAAPLDMVDTCLCMGAGITIAQGLHAIEPDAVNFAFVGDSTFFHTGIPGVINAVYNEHRIVLIVLDNSTTAMTGHQPHPGIGKKVSGEITSKIDIAAVLQAVGVQFIETVDPLDLKAAVETVARAADFDGVSAIIFRSPCIALFKPTAIDRIDPEKCTNCKKCIRELGCPALMVRDGQVTIEESLCYGCHLCSQVCPTAAISAGGKE